MRKSDAIQYFGSALMLASAFGITREAIYQWGDLIPIGRAYQIQSITNGQLKVDPSLYANKKQKK